MKSNNITFSGINISNADVLGHKIKTYQLTAKDAAFIDKLKNEVNLKELYPNISQESFEIFNTILNKSFGNAFYKNKSSLLLSCDNKPCGIMVNSQNTVVHSVEYICTWPLSPNCKAPFGAQTLFEEMYRNFLNTQAKLIKICAIRYGDAISKYRNVGFSSNGGDNYTEIMQISREKVHEFYLKLKQRINLIPTNESKDIDLFQELKY